MPTDLEDPQILAALVAGIVALVIGLITVTVNAFITAWVADRKVRADREQALSQKAWADYELRRDVYMDVARQVEALFEGGTREAREELNRTARQARIVGSDHVVMALNDLFGGIRDGLGPEIHEQRYRSLFNAMRRDIRQLHTLPPQGTDLGEEAFPVEGARA